MTGIITDRLETIAKMLEEAHRSLAELSNVVSYIGNTVPPASEVSPALIGLMVLILAVFVGYYVVWKVTPALHSPLMSVTNAISSVVIIGAIIAAGQETHSVASMFGFIAIVIATVNIVGGFLVTYRMLAMFDQNKK
jgi:NAD(P) transhydrogenase subunit alpha